MTVTTDTRHLTASMVVIDPRARMVLLVWQRASGLWLFPGGHVDDGESPRAAALREVREETGTDAALAPVPQPWLIEEHAAPAKPARPGKPAEPPHTHEDHLFVGTADSRAPLAAQLDEVAAARWVPLDALDGLDVRAEVPGVAREVAALLGAGGGR